MPQHKFCTKFCILEQFGAEIEVILFVYPFNFSAIFHAFINIHDYTNKTIFISYRTVQKKFNDQELVCYQVKYSRMSCC